jgi:3-methyl-2-oxobutanoate hydroxymethyltransferase
MKSDSDLRAMKGREKVAMITAYDYPQALMLEDSGIDVVLVGDSLAEVVYGYPNTTHADMELMLRHVEAVRRGLGDIHLLGDMPIHSCDDPEQALANAKRMVNAGAQSVKMENPKPSVVERVVQAGIPVFGHVGLTPQTIHDYKKQGKDPVSAARILSEARAQEKAGCFGLVVEAIPDSLAGEITQALHIPVIGIAAGSHCDGQVLVFHDLFGFYSRERSYVHKLTHVHELVRAAAGQYARQVKAP